MQYFFNFLQNFSLSDLPNYGYQVITLQIRKYGLLFDFESRNFLSTYIIPQDYLKHLNSKKIFSSFFIKNPHDFTINAIKIQ